MSTPATWRAEWSLNLPVLDRDHRALMERLDQISLRFSPQASASTRGDGPALVDALADLGEAARAHFRRTTDLMSEAGYDDIQGHHSECALLMAEYAEMLRAWREQDLQSMDVSAQLVVRDWLLAHILGADRDFVGAYQGIRH